MFKLLAVPLHHENVLISHLKSIKQPTAQHQRARLNVTPERNGHKGRRGVERREGGALLSRPSPIDKRSGKNLISLSHRTWRSTNSTVLFEAEEVWSSRFSTDDLHLWRRDLCAFSVFAKSKAESSGYCANEDFDCQYRKIPRLLFSWPFGRCVRVLTLTFKDPEGEWDWGYAVSDREKSWWVFLRVPQR